MRLIDADELRKYMERHCEFCKRSLRIYEYLQGRCELCPMSQVYDLIDPEAGLKTHDEAVQIHLEKRSDEERPAYMQGYKAGIEKGHKDMLGYYPQTMTEEKLNEITSRVCDIFRHTEFYDCMFCDKGMGGDCIECEEKYTVYSLLDVIASLHNELYKQVKGKYFDYMFHWANLGYGGSPNDSIFKDQKEGDDNEKADS